VPVADQQDQKVMTQEVTEYGVTNAKDAGSMLTDTLRKTHASYVGL